MNNKKKIMLFAIPLLLVGLVSAGVLTNFLKIDYGFEVERALTYSGDDCDDNGVCTESSGDLVGGETYTTGTYELTSATSVNAPLTITTEITPDDAGITTGFNFIQDVAAIPYEDGTGYLNADFEAGREVVTLLVEEATTLSDVESIDFEQYVTKGYPASVNILIDVDGDGEFNSKKDLVTGYLTTGVDDVLKMEIAYNGATAGYADAYMEESDYNRWMTAFDEGAIGDTTSAWLYSVKPGDVQIVDGTLAEFKAGINRGTSCYYVSDVWYEETCDDLVINGASKVYGIQIETLGWIAESSAKIRNVELNGVALEPTLLPLESMSFESEVTLGIGNFGTYEVTTTVQERV